MQTVFTATCVFALAACGGPKDVELGELGIKVTTPANWDAEMTEFSVGAGSAEMKKDGKTYGFIDPDVSMPLGTDRKAWPKEGPHELAHLEAAVAKLSPEAAESFDGGFGLRYAKGDKKSFFYVVKVGDRELSCRPNVHIEPADIPDAISICKSIRGQ